VFQLDDLDLLNEITHPTRSAIVRRLKEPRSVAELAEALDVPVTRLYHHVNKLEGLGLIRVVATRQVAAVTERRYQVAGKSFDVAPELLQAADPKELAIALGSLFDVAKLSLQRAVEAGGASQITEHNSLLSLGEVTVTPDRREEMTARLRDLIEEFKSDDDGTERVTFFAALFREP
jgi:DNA-binding transcriptional ArsR family regulator